MFIFCICLLVAAVIAGLVQITDGTVKIKHLIKAFGAVIIVSLFVSTATVLISYINYVKTKTTYDTIITQYKGAIELYADKAVLHIDKVFVTDFQYQGYQENMAELVKDLRSSVIGCNKTIIMKRLLGKNILFKGLIVQPDPDMVPINIYPGKE